MKKLIYGIFCLTVLTFGISSCVEEEVSPNGEPIQQLRGKPIQQFDGDPIQQGS